jgi:hypothetical protein
MAQVQSAPEAPEFTVFGPRVTFEFGYRGGNMVAATVTINVGGQVIPSGHVRVLIPNLTLSQETIFGLITLTEAERFFDLPDTIPGPVGNPDVASAFITITLTLEGGPTRKKTVVEHPGSREPRFDQLFSVLTAVSGVVL